MTLWILDTDHISLFQTGHPLVIQKIQTAEPTNLAVTIVSLEEQMYGRLNRIRRAKSVDLSSFTYRSCPLLRSIHAGDFIPC